MLSPLKAQFWQRLSSVQHSIHDNEWVYDWLVNETSQLNISEKRLVMSSYKNKQFPPQAYMEDLNMYGQCMMKIIVLYLLKWWSRNLSSVKWVSLTSNVTIWFAFYLFANHFVFLQPNVRKKTYFRAKICLILLNLTTVHTILFVVV